MLEITDEIREKLEEEHRNGNVAALMILAGNKNLASIEDIKEAIAAQNEMGLKWYDEGKTELAEFCTSTIQGLERVLAIFGCQDD